MLSSRNACVVELIPDALRVTCLGGRVAHHVIGCAPGQEDAAVKQLSALVPSGGCRVIGLAPRMACSVRLFSLPSRDPEELLGIARLQFARTTPHKSSDIIVDVRVLEQKLPNQSLVAGAMIAKDQMAAFVDILGRAGMHPDEITMNTQRLLPLARAVWPDAVSGESRILGVYVQGAFLLGLFSGGRMLFSREERMPGGRDAALGMFLDYCHKEFPAESVREIRLLGDRDETGMPGSCGGIAVKVQELSLLVRTPREREAFALSPAAYLDVLLAAEGPSGAFDLATDEVKARRRASRGRLLCVHGGILAALLILGVVLFGWAGVLRESRMNTAMLEEVERSSLRVRDLEGKSRALAAIAARAAEPAATMLLSLVAQAVPADARLTRVEINDGKLDIRGEAAGLDSVRALEASLKSAAVFHDVRLDGIDKRPTESAQVVTFRISMRVEK